MADQQTQVENLKSALTKLDAKLVEARAKCDMLIAQHRRARAIGKAVDAASVKTSLSRVEQKVLHESAVSQARAGLLEAGSEEQLERLVKEDKIDQMLAELKARKSGPARIEGSTE